MFKRFLITAILSLSLFTLAHAAPATVTETEWGYTITGGTDATAVSTETIYIKSIGFTPAANTDDVLIYNNTSGVSFYQFKFSVTAYQPFMYFGEGGVKLTKPMVKLTSASDILYIYTKQ